MTTPEQADLLPTQADRDAAADYLTAITVEPNWDRMRIGDLDGSPLVQAFARHRAHSQPSVGEGHWSQEREDAFMNIIAAIDAAGMCPGVGTISEHDEGGMVIQLALSNEHIRKAAHREQSPEGYRLVPVEPTKAMLQAGFNEGYNLRDIWSAMLAAAPALSASPAQENHGIIYNGPQYGEELDALKIILADSGRDA